MIHSHFRRVAAACALLVVFTARPLAARSEPVELDTLKIAPAGLREDLAIVRAAFEEGHPGLHRFTSEREWDHAFADAEKRLDHPMTAWEFYRVLAPIVATIRCGHSRVELPDTLFQVLNTTRRLLPLQVRVQGDRAWIVRDLATDDERWTGSELLAVNGVRTHALLATLLAATPRDGFGETMAPQSLRRYRFAGMLERMFGFDGRYEVELRDPHGRVQRTTIEGVTLPEQQQRVHARHPADDGNGANAEFELLDGGKIARLKLHAFAGTVSDSDTTGIRGFFERSFETLRDRRTAVLILDLRDNGGGEDALGKILFARLVDHPFAYYDDLVLNGRGFSFEKYVAHFDSVPARLCEKRDDGKYHLVGHPNWGTQQPLEPRFSGRVIALMNGASFSTTCEFLSHLRDLHRATFVGEESGGAYVGNTSGRVVRVVLPNTRAQVGVPILRYDLAVAPAKPFGRGIRPDVPVRTTVADWIAGRDVELAKALELARRSPTALAR